MTDTITNATVCSGGNHVTIFVSDGTNTRQIHLDIKDVRPSAGIVRQINLLNDISDADKPILLAAFQAARAANATTLQQIRTAIVGVSA
jgi:hypothetical protein